MPSWSKLLPKIVNRTKEFEYTHRWNLLVIETHVRFVLSYQERFPYPELTLFKVEEVMVIGNITISTPALARLLEAKVQISYLSKYGQYLGNLSPALTKNSLLRLAQHQAYNNGMRRHAIAQRFVVGKLRNMRTILMRYHRLYPDPMIGTQIESLKH